MGQTVTELTKHEGTFGGKTPKSPTPQAKKAYSRRAVTILP